MCSEGKIGINIEIPNSNISNNQYLFGEDQSRYIIEISETNKNEVYGILKENSVYFELIGKTIKENMVIKNEFNISIDELKKIMDLSFRKLYLRSLQVLFMIFHRGAFC